ncbi:EXS family-domain-containing protein [Tribonema minus]|uniref:EXS family-domain-containing protein n=1 Tax=Tribonema minus TaxID=303371 RepID=A0A835YVP0_9STRA|nr:EXS family-domain-containing protein [Tribonema minus]
MEELYRLCLRVPIVLIVFGCLCGVVMLALDQLGIDYAYHAKKASKLGECHQAALRLRCRETSETVCVLTVASCASPLPLPADKSRSAALQLVLGSGFLLALLLLCLRIGELAQIMPNVAVGAFAIMVGLMLLVPMQSAMRDGLNFLLSTVGRVLCPSSDVPFVEVLVADALCSLSRVFSDAGLAILVLAATWTSSAPPSQVTRVFVTATLACLPAVLRVRQCAILHFAEPDPARRRLHALNIGKYLSTLPPVLLGALHALAPPALDGVPLATAAAAAAAFNTAYCLAWDVRMDWGLGDLGAKAAGLRPTLLLGAHAPYYAAIAADAALRCAWVRPLAALGYALALTDLTLVLELVEVCRRCMWAVLRLEWEAVQHAPHYHHPAAHHHHHHAQHHRLGAEEGGSSGSGADGEKLAGGV